MPLWFLLALSATVFWAIGYNLIKKGFQNISPLWNNIVANILSIIFWMVPVLFLSHFKITNPTLSGIGYLIIITLAYMAFPYAVSKGQISLSAALFALYPVVTVILSVLFLGERLTSLQGVGAITALLGSVLIAWPNKKIKVRSYDWILWGGFGALISGIGDFYVKISTNQIGEYSNIFYMVIMFNILSVLNYLVDKNGRKLPPLTFKNITPTIIAWCFILSGGLLFLLAFGHGPASLVSTVSASNPALVAVLAVIFLKEKITLHQMLGIATVVAGIVMIGLGT